ncbi:dienelactone hydrolase [Massilia sp. Se16.2.3]|nr:CocE/NonD family hydrolase [Massilia sp. Se16.2.3]QNB00312.1 dienelactone hydrolase [Massilia sp. Se16.2.3]
MRFLLTLALLLSCAQAQATSRFTLRAPPGPHPVGFRLVEQQDFSRVLYGKHDPVSGRATAGPPGRPIQTLVWYPATRSGQAMRYDDYLQLIGSETAFGRSREERRSHADAFVRQEYVSESGPEQAARELAAPVRARRDAVAATGKRYPVVIYAPSISAPAAENADLCEFLASHGYIVLASPSVGLHDREMTNDLAGAETQAADIAFLVAHAHGLPDADTDRIAVAGYSWGGLANVLAASRDSRIKALVNLDGSVRYYADVVAAASYLKPENLRAPLLYVAARPMSSEELAARGKPVSRFLDEVKHADVYKLTMFPMEHFAFSSTYLRFASDARFNQYTRDEVIRAHGWTLDYVRRFLDAYLKDDAPARAYLAATPLANGLPAHAATMERRLATAPPASREQFAAQLARRGFRDAHAAYLKLYGKDAGLLESELNAGATPCCAAATARPRSPSSSSPPRSTRTAPTPSTAWPRPANAAATRPGRSATIGAHWNSLRGARMPASDSRRSAARRPAKQAERGSANASRRPWTRALPFRQRHSGRARYGQVRHCLVFMFASDSLDPPIVPRAACHFSFARSAMVLYSRHRSDNSTDP